MSGGSRRSISSADNSQNQKTSILTLSVLGLSGTDSQKGAVGVGKSVFCNRLVRPHYNDFNTEHVSYLSQADFNCSSVINGNHWLYWGEVDLDRSDYAGPSNRIRVIEQTTFLNDETFEPHPSRIPDYCNRAVRTELESKGKLMYICRDQLGQESDFVCHELQNGKAKVDAFAIMYDVSYVDGRMMPFQTEKVTELVNLCLKTKKPVFLLASKCDKQDPNGMSEFRKLCSKKEFAKTSNFHWAEISAFDNVNVADFLYLLAQTVDKVKNKLNMSMFVDSERLRTRRLTAVSADFNDLLHQLVPREDFPSQQGQLSWEVLLTDFGVNCHPAYIAYVAEYGARSAASQFEEHCRVLREWWLERELNERLPVLRDVLRRMFGRSYMCQTNWEQLRTELEAHPHFPTYFQPLGRSVERYKRRSEVDDRIPSEVLQKPEARDLFHEYQRELLDEIALERQADKFRKLLETKDAVTPGRTYSDAKVMCHEITEFENALPPENARYIYEDYQKDLKKKAQLDFNELLLENISTFVDLIVEWRTKQLHDPNRISCLSEREFNIICSSLIEDKRYRDMSGLADKRRELISKMANFVSMPLTCFCLAGDKCADVIISQMVADIRYDANAFCSIEADLFGESDLVNKFMWALNSVLPADKLYHQNDRVAKLNIHPANRRRSVQNNRVRTPICLIDSAKTCHQLLSESEELFKFGPSPLFVLIPNKSNKDISDGLERMGTQLADRFHGVYIGVKDLEDDIMNNDMNGSRFDTNQLDQVLHELCLGQMGTNYTDMKVRVSFLCDDSLSMQQVLTPLLDQVVQTDDSGGSFCLDVSLSNEPLNVRVGFQCGSYHHWMLSKWQLNTYNGHILVYSPNRMASWKHAETSIQLLLDASAYSVPSPSNLLERQNMARSIMLIAVDEPSSYFKDKDSSHLLAEGARLAEKIGCKFMVISSSMPQTAQFQFYNDYFSQLIRLPALPDATYTVCSQNPALFVTKRQPTYLNHSTVTGSALTLLTNYSSSGSSSLVSSNPSSAQNTTAQCSQIPSLNHEFTSTSPTPPLSARSTESRAQPTSEEMTNRLRRPLSAIGSLMSASQSAENGSQSSHDEPGDVLTTEGLSKNLRFSPSKFRRLFQRNAGSESSASTDEKASKKQLQRSSTVDGVSKPEVVPASELNGFTSYIKVPDINANNVGGDSPKLGVRNQSLEERDRNHEGRNQNVEVKNQKFVNDLNFIVSNQSRSLKNQPSVNNQNSKNQNPLQKNQNLSVKSLNLTVKDSNVDNNRLTVNNFEFDRKPRKPHKSHSVESIGDIQMTPRIEQVAQDDENQKPIERGRQSRMKRFTHRCKELTTKARRRGHSMTPRINLVSGSPTSSAPHSPSDLSYTSECKNDDDIPSFLRVCVQHIERVGGLDTEGLYRTSGNQAEANELEAHFRRTGQFKPDAELSSAVTALKNYVNAFAEPLIPTRLHEEIINIFSDRDDVYDSRPLETKSLDRLRRLFERELPRVNARTLMFLCAHLCRVADNRARNLMPTSNLALIWSASIFRPELTSVSKSASLLARYHVACYFCIKHHHILFSLPP
ncbi:unnamed protein product [Bursaphelenchus okinawaensis]|uniref:Rho-GAP domain-containing protein n=1 Tax=Bursaphelenchus okinawaensis TaxID=465554 RepID=A0A811KU40_9BILA|nr:unnamed protein product [Bursaphelenchus okinawaensis]CAG9111637.1 unnamed protein product [Bursaphelenchus okinawaensis]